MSEAKINTTGIDLRELTSSANPEPQEKPARTKEPDTVKEVEEPDLPAPELDLPPIELPPLVITFDHEDQVERRKYIMMLQRYYTSERFGSWLVNTMKFRTDMQQMSLEQIKNELEAIRFCIRNKQCSTAIQRVVPGAIAVAEMKLYPHLYLMGLSAQLQQSDTFKDILEEIALENQSFMYGSPYARLAYTILTTGALVHEANKAAMTEKTKDKPLKDDLAKKVSSLKQSAS